MSYGAKPWQQLHWDVRAAGNFMAGGAGAGLLVATSLAGGPRWAWLAGAAGVVAGLLSVSLEMGRPLRAPNVLRHPQRSWMTREAMVAPLLLAAALAAALGLPVVGLLAGGAGLAYVFCQGQMLRAAKGIPAWREPLTLPLVVATGLAEGSGAFLLLMALAGERAARSPIVWLLLVLALGARWWLWSNWRSRLRTAPRALAEIDRAGRVFIACTGLPLLAALAMALVPGTPLLAKALPLAAGALALAGGAWFKYTLITRAAYNQGFALPHLPVRGVRRGAP